MILSISPQNSWEVLDSQSSDQSLLGARLVGEQRKQNYSNACKELAI